MEAMTATDPEATTDGTGQDRDAEREEPTTAAETSDRGAEALPGREHTEPERDTMAEPGWVKELAERNATAHEKLAEREAVQVPSEDPEAEDRGMAWPDLLDRERDPLLHPAELDMRPSIGVLAEMSRQAEAGGPEASG